MLSPEFSAEMHRLVEKLAHPVQFIVDVPPRVDWNQPSAFINRTEGLDAAGWPLRDGPELMQ